MLSSNNLKCYGTFLHTILFLLINDVKASGLLLNSCEIDALLRSFTEKYRVLPDNLLCIIFRILRILIITSNYKLIMSIELYQFVIKAFMSDEVQVAKHALIQLSLCADEELYQEYFLKFNVASLIVQKLETTTNEDLLRNILIFTTQAIARRELAMEFLLETSCLKSLKTLNADYIHTFEITEVIKMLYDTHLPIKFHDSHRLDFEDKIENGFYLINLDNYFVFVENLTKTATSSIHPIYIVDFGNNLPQYNIEPQSSEEAPSTFNGFRLCICPFICVNFCRRRSSIDDVSVEQALPSTITQMYGIHPKYINYGGLSSDPFLPKYFSQISAQANHDDFYVKIRSIARLIAKVLPKPKSQEDFKEHIAKIKAVLGTNLIPIGFLRFGYSCERALLFKALADRVNLQTNLVRTKIYNTNTFKYWNEVLIDGTITVVVDLIDNVGSLLKTGELKAYYYCGFAPE